MEHLNRYLSEAVSKGKKVVYFPEHQDFDAVVAWLDKNGFKRLPDWTPSDSGRVQKTGGLRYQVGPFRAEMSKWISVNDSEEYSMTLKFGKSKNGNYFLSDYYEPRQGAEPVQWWKVEELLNEMIARG